MKKQLVLVLLIVGMMGGIGACNQGETLFTTINCWDYGDGYIDTVCGNCKPNGHDSSGNVKYCCTGTNKPAHTSNCYTEINTSTFH